MSILIAQYFLNHRLDPTEVAWQMEQFARRGYQGVCAHARPGMLTPYFSESWWQALDTMLEVCRRTGLEFWIWDEDYFPSGLCGGRVLWSDPGLAARELKFKTGEVSGAGPFEMDFETGLLLRAFALPRQPDGAYGEAIDVTKFCGTRRQHWGPRYMLHRAYSPGINPIGHPHWRSAMADNRFAMVWTPPEPGEYVLVGVTVDTSSTTHPDLLRPEGIASFIRLSHEEYSRRYGEELGRTVRGSFTDEPSPGALLYPWSAGFPAEFTSDHGYDLTDFLHHLVLDLDDRSAAIRHHYRLTQHRLVKRNYLEQITDWCHDHNLVSMGHLTRTEWLSLVAAWWPNELRCYQAMDIPAADPLGASCGWQDAASYHTGLKVAASAAHLFNKQQASADCVAVIGDEASLRDLKYLFDWHLVLGINHFVVHGLSYSIDGPRKDEVPPSIFYQHTEWPYMKVLLDHVRETAAALTGGRHLCELAVLYPSTSLGCQLRPDLDWMQLADEPLIHSLVENLLSHHRDFDFIDELTLQEAVDESGRLQTPETYRAIILPYLRYLDARTARALEKYAGSGGRVIAVGSWPRLISAGPAPEVTDWLDSPVQFAETLGHETMASLPGVQVTGEGAEDLFVLRREKESQVVTFAFNRREQWFTGEVDGAAVQVAPRSSVLLHNGLREAPCLPGTQPGATGLDLSSGWRVRFPANHLPLNFWHVPGPQVKPSACFTSGPAFDLMQRQPDPAGDGENPVSYYCRFMLTGEISDARLVIEDSTLTGNWQLFVNDRPVADWRRARVFDCLNLEAEIGSLLRTGSTPTLNVVRVDTSGPGRGLHEIPYLYGCFTCQYRYGHLSFPFVQESGSDQCLSVLQPWDILGYPTFSGTAVYSRQFTVPEAGDYLLDLGRVEDVAAISLDGEQIKVLAWEPYRCLMSGLSGGEHQLTVEVSNPPANRNRAAGLPAGLLGPVRLTRV